VALPIHDAAGPVAAQHEVDPRMSSRQAGREFSPTKHRDSPTGPDVAWAPALCSLFHVILLSIALVWAMAAEEPLAATLASSMAAGGVGSGQQEGNERGVGTGEGAPEQGSGSGDEGSGSGSGEDGEGAGAGQRGEGPGGVPAAGGQDSLAASAEQAEPTFPAAAAEPEPPTVELAAANELEPGFTRDVPGVVSPPRQARALRPPGTRSARGAGGGAGSADRIGARGQFSCTLVWRYRGRQPNRLRGGPDIDCWVVDPRGQRLSSSQEGFGLGPTPEKGQIDVDDQGAYGPGNGSGPERVFWPDGAAPLGHYRFGVRWYNGTGKVRYTFRVYLGTKLHKTFRGTLNASRQGQNVELGTVRVE